MENVKFIKNNVQVYLGLAAVILASIIINIFLRAGYSFDELVVGRGEYIKLIQNSIQDVALVTIIKRLKQLLIVYVIYKIINIDIAYCAVTTILCFLFGSMISIQSYYGGVMSVIELLLFLLPHYIFYILIIRNMYVYVKWKNRSKVYVCVMILLLFMSGLLCEIFFSRFFLNEFYQYMVLI